MDLTLVPLACKRNSIDLLFLTSHINKYCCDNTCIKEAHTIFHLQNVIIECNLIWISWLLLFGLQQIDVSMFYFKTTNQIVARQSKIRYKQKILHNPTVINNIYIQMKKVISRVFQKRRWCVVHQDRYFINQKKIQIKLAIKSSIQYKTWSIKNEYKRFETILPQFPNDLFYKKQHFMHQ